MVSAILQAKVDREGYSFVQPIPKLTGAVVESAMTRFDELKAQGTIIADSFHSNKWAIYDEVHKSVNLNFSFDELRFERICKPLLGCSAGDYATAIRVYAVESRHPATSLRTFIRMFCDFVNTLDASFAFEHTIGARGAECLLRVLHLLPSETDKKRSIVNLVQNIVRWGDKDKEKGPRTLSFYESYFLFDHLIKQFWKFDATPTEKILYFPIWFWWTLTIHLPLRPTECALTPRKCLSYIDQKPHITVRRTLRKGDHLSSKYNLEGDYEKTTHPITSELAIEVESYIKATSEIYQNENDTLFCKASQFMYLENNKKHDGHYNYYNLDRLLDVFFAEVICRKYGYKVIAKTDGDDLAFGEIEKISLGDTRHVSMITLILSGSSPYVCKELARHKSIITSSGYYNNLKNMLKVLSTTPTRDPVCPGFVYDDIINRPPSVKVPQGLCFSQCYLLGDYTDCSKAVNEYGFIGSCSACKYFLEAIDSDDTLNEPEGTAIQSRLLMLGEAIDQVRQGIGNTDRIEIALAKLQAQARLYTNRLQSWQQFRQEVLGQ